MKLPVAVGNLDLCGNPLWVYAFGEFQESGGVLYSSLPRF